MNRVYSEQAVNELLGILASVIYQAQLTLIFFGTAVQLQVARKSIYQPITIKKNQ
jgi:hypothetical protein